jgi:DNA mismatch repair protein MutL
MGRVHLLEDAVINKIAAGEVVERPASVVKELVENAIDAQATAIRIELEEGGRRKIVVTDDGYGMSEEDARLAIVRHATSKISAVEDLYSVDSMGFRGEALASIASVSQFSLMTRQGQDSVGTRIQTDGSIDLSVTPWHGPRGTTMAVESLFFNIPVREKFLKSPASEFAHCHELIQNIALARPEVSFTLLHNGKEYLSAPRVCEREELQGSILTEKTVRRRAAQILSQEVVDELLYVTESNQYGEVEALISPPGVEKPTGKHIATFVNRRVVKDKTLRFGIMRGYSSHLLTGKYPRVLAFMTIDPSLYDVNVHPTKEELRFQYPTEVQGLISLAIRGRIRHGDWVRVGNSLDDADIRMIPSLHSGNRATSASMQVGGEGNAMDVNNGREPTRSMRSFSGNVEESLGSRPKELGSMRAQPLPFGGSDAEANDQLIPSREAIVGDATTRFNL